jgi:hypothetical protein
MARSFDGSNDAMHFPVPGGAATAYSQHLWVQIASNPGSNKSITTWAEDYNSATHEKYLDMNTSGVTNWTSFDGASKTTSPSAPAMTANVWAAQGMTQSTTTLLHYFNGTQVGTVAASGIYNGYVSPVCELGHSSHGGFWAGQIAEYAIWTEVLTADEMAALAKGISPLLVRPQALLRYLPLLQKGTETELIEAQTVTHVDSPAVYDGHPRIYKPQSAIYFP